MNEGCPHEGVDHRLLGRLGCWIQSRLSFHSTTAPAELACRYLSLRFPLYIGIAIPLGSKYLTVRVGYRWDPFWAYPDNSGRTGGYIFPEAIIKTFDHIVL